jgi:hypothetical protein
LVNPGGGRVKWPELLFKHPTTYRAEINEKVELEFYHAVCLHGSLYDEIDLLHKN